MFPDCVFVCVLVQSEKKEKKGDEEKAGGRGLGVG